MIINIIILKSMYKPTTCRSSSWHVDVQYITAEVPVGKGHKGIGGDKTLVYSWRESLHR